MTDQVWEPELLFGILSRPLCNLILAPGSQAGSWGHPVCDVDLHPPLGSDLLAGGSLRTEDRQASGCAETAKEAHGAELAARRQAAEWALLGPAGTDWSCE